MTRPKKSSARFPNPVCPVHGYVMRFRNSKPLAEGGRIIYYRCPACREVVKRAERHDAAGLLIQTSCLPSSQRMPQD